jgi:hypothetical protein
MGDGGGDRMGGQACKLRITVESAKRVGPHLTRSLNGAGHDLHRALNVPANNREVGLSRLNAPFKDEMREAIRRYEG